MNLSKLEIRYKLLYKAILAFVFTIPLSQYLSIRLLIVALLLTLLKHNIKAGALKLLRNSWEIFLYILILLIGLLYSSNLDSGLRVIETNLSLLAVPFIFFLVADFNEKEFNNIFNVFALGLLVACSICLLNASINYTKTGDINSFFFYDLTDILYLQPTYFAYYLIFAITYFLYRSYYQLTDSNYLIQLVGTLFFFIILMLTAGQTAFVSILLILSFFILKFIIESKSNKKKIVIAFVGIMLISMFLTALIDKESRNLSSNDAWDRLILWESAIDATPDLLFGVGTGDYKSSLNEYYLTHNLQKFAEESYNSHNQFIQVLFSNGLLGVASMLLLIGRPLYLSVKNHNLLGILLVFPFLIYGITEVFMGRYQGVVFFALVHQLCILQPNVSRDTVYSDQP